MKPEDAKQKWCPMSRYVPGGSPGWDGGNRFDVESTTGRNYFAQCFCIGPACMMWRWWDEDKENSEGGCGLCFEGSDVFVTHRNASL